MDLSALRLCAHRARRRFKNSLEGRTLVEDREFSLLEAYDTIRALPRTTPMQTLRIIPGGRNHKTLVEYASTTPKTIMPLLRQRYFAAIHDPGLMGQYAKAHVQTYTQAYRTKNTPEQNALEHRVYIDLLRGPQSYDLPQSPATAPQARAHLNRQESKDRESTHAHPPLNTVPGRLWEHLEISYVKPPPQSTTPKPATIDPKV